MERKKALITGITGFAGSHLAEWLVSQGNWEVSGTNISDNVENVASIKDKLQLHKVNLLDEAGTFYVIDTVKPDVIYHLAAFPSPAESFKNPAEFIQNNINAQLNVLEAVKNSNLLQTKILIVSSAEVYGLIAPEDLPIDEETPFKPVNPYAVSKIAQDMLGLQYHLAYHMPIVRVRPFGHIGPRLSPQFAASAFAKKIAEIEKKKQEPILTVGNLDSRRALTDVRDIVRAYALLIEKGIPGEVYNLGLEQSYKIKDILDMLLAMSNTHIEVKIDPQLIRPNDIPELRCDNTKVKKATGWKPEIPIEKSVRDTLEYWRGQI